MRADALVDYRLDRWAVVRRNGDIDERFALSLRNVGSAPYSFVENDTWVWFAVTDSAAECVYVHDSDGPGGWFTEQQRHAFVVGKRPDSEIPVGGERVFFARLRRPRRLEASEEEIRFDDPLLLEPLEPLNGTRAHYRATVIFPERHDGWEIVAPEATATTRRAAIWESPHDGSHRRRLWVTARAPAPVKDASVLFYDDIMAELDLLIAAGFGAEPIDLAGLLGRAKFANDAFVLDLLAPLAATDRFGGVADRSCLKPVLESMMTMRETFLRRHVSSSSPVMTTARPPVDGILVAPTPSGRSPAPTPAVVEPPGSAPSEPRLWPRFVSGFMQAEHELERCCRSLRSAAG